ncbi:hypothetical protein ACP70R_002670 [Stipagrostis hirtigluma subsp. patula]
MEAKIMIVSLLLLLCLCHIGNGEECTLSDLAVIQTAEHGGDHPQYAVAVENRCICTQAQVKLSCPGFSSSMGVDPGVLRPDGDGKLCTLNDGRPIAMGPGYAIKFSYTSSSEIGFKPASSTVACS